MRGLLYKDLCNLKKQVFIVLLFTVLYGIYGIAVKQPSFMGSLVIVFSIMMPITSMSYDEAFLWYRYALATPISRRKLVLSKYVLGLLVALAGLVGAILISFAGSLISHTPFGMEQLITFGLFLEAGMLFLSITVPVMFRHGVEKGRLLITVFAVAPTLLLVPLATFLSKAGLSLPDEETLMGILIASPLFILAIFLFSFRYSVHILSKKEF